MKHIKKRIEARERKLNSQVCFLKEKKKLSVKLGLLFIPLQLQAEIKDELSLND
jgi:hypothetical protein